MSWETRECRRPTRSRARCCTRRGSRRPGPGSAGRPRCCGCPAGADPSETAVSVRRALTELDPDLAIHRLATGGRAVRGGTGAAPACGGVAGRVRRDRARARHHRALRRDVHGGGRAAAGNRCAHGARCGAEQRARDGHVAGGAAPVHRHRARRRWWRRASTKVLATMLYETSPVDPVTFVARGAAARCGRPRSGADSGAEGDGD